MKTPINLFVVVTSISLGAIPALGFTYNEAIQGDIPNQGAPPLFNFDLGDNVIRGSTHFGTLEDPATSDPDLFSFHIPQGTMLSLGSIVYQYNVTGLFGDSRALGAALQIWTSEPGDTTVPNYSTGGLNNNGPFFYIHSDGSEPSIHVSPSPVNLQLFQVVDSSVDVSLPAPPLQAGLYWMSQGASKFGIGDFGGSWDYSITLTVTPVPEPSGLILFAASAVLCWVAKRSLRRVTCARG